MSTRMLEEIHEQPAALERTLAHLSERRRDLASLVDGVQRVTLYGRGSSDAACVYGRYLLEVHAGVPAALGAPSVSTLYAASPRASGSLAVVVSQSGTTAEMVDTARWARRCGARVLAVTNTEDSELEAAADLALVTAAGPERAVPATKTYVTQLLALAALASAFRPLDLEPLPAAAASSLALSKDRSVTSAATVLAPAAAAVVGGRGLLLGTALELALKLQETCAIAALGLSAADLQHGPVAVLGRGVPLLLVAAAAGPTVPGLKAVSEAARGRGAPVVVLGGDAELQSTATAAIAHSPAAAALPETLLPVVAVIIGQLLVEATAAVRGVDPDAPYRLTKVTQTE